MSLLGNTEYIKTKSGEYIEVRRGLFHTHVTLPDGTEIELDTDIDGHEVELDKRKVETLIQLLTDFDK